MRFKLYEAAPRFWRILGCILTVLILLTFGIIFLSAPALVYIINHTGSSSLGRKFTINGPLHIGWDWNELNIAAENITLSNAPNLNDPNMVEISKVYFRIKIWKLLYGRTELPYLRLENPKIILEKTADGTKNWDLPIFSSGSIATKAALPSNRRQFPVIGELSIVNGDLIYHDDPKKLNLDLKLSSVSAEGGKGRQKFIINGNGTLQGQDFAIQAHGGSLNMLREGADNYPLNLQIDMGATHVDVSGSFQDPIALKGIDASLKITGHTMADLFYLTLIPLPPTPPYSIEGHLGKNGDLWTYEKFTGKFGDSDLSGDLFFDTSGERGLLKGNLKSHHMDVKDLGGFIGLAPSKPSAAPEQKAIAEKQKESPRLLPDTSLNLTRLRASDLDVTLDADQLVAPSLPFNGMNVHFKLNDGLLKLDPMTLSLADGTAQGTLQLDARQDVPSVATNLDLKNIK